MNETAMEEHNSVEFTLYSPLSPPELLEHIRANTYSCYIAASFGTLKNADYTFIVQSESDNEIILQPVGFLRNSEQPNLLLKLYQREIGEGTDIEVFVLRQKIIWPVLIVCLAGLLFGGLIHFLVILLIPIGLLVLITCQGIAESEIPQLKESLTELLKIRS